MNFERVDEHLRMLRSFLKAELDDDLADSERRLAEAIAEGKEYSRMHYQESVDWLKARRDRLEAEERDAA
jgi:hypothetical protein